MRGTRIVKTLSLFLFGVVMAFSAGCQTSQGGIQVDPSAKVQAFLGDDVIQIVSRPDRIEPFLLQSAFEPDPTLTGPHAIAGYTWTARGAALSLDDQTSLRTMILQEASYDFEVAKKCPFVPEVALRFHRGTDHVDLLLSFSCAQWQFEHGDAQKLEDFDPVKADLRAIVETVFKLDQ